MVFRSRPGGTSCFGLVSNGGIDTSFCCRDLTCSVPRCSPSHLLKSRGPRDLHCRLVEWQEARISYHHVQALEVRLCEVDMTVGLQVPDCSSEKLLSDQGARILPCLRRQRCFPMFYELLAGLPPPYLLTQVLDRLLFAEPRRVFCCAMLEFMRRGGVDVRHFTMLRQEHRLHIPFDDRQAFRGVQGGRIADLRGLGWK